jgi:hypothetical protein
MDRSAQNLQPTSIQRTTTDDGGEPHTNNITSKCTTVCGDLRIGRSCGKTVLVDVYSVAAPNKTMSQMQIHHQLIEHIYCWQACQSR